MVDDGIWGVLKAIGRFLWPVVTDDESARKALWEGVYAVAAIVVIQSILVTLSAFGRTLFGITVRDWVDGAVFAAIGWGIYKQSRAASVLGIILFVVERFVSWTILTTGSIEEVAGRVVIALVLMLMFINGARGTFARHRLETASARAAGSLPSDSPTRWKVYSAVLASFAFGVLALRLYQSLIGSAPPISRTGGAFEDLPALVKRVRPAVVTIIAYDSKGLTIGQGSGFFVSKEGEILTNHHVLQGASSAEIKMNDGATHPVAAILGDDADSDLSRLIAILDDTMPFLPIAHQRAEAGERIVVIGSPLGLEHTVSEGIVSAIPEERSDVGEIMPATLQITAQISEGSSGAPVLNLKGEVVGLATAYLRRGQGLNFAVPLERILTLKRTKPITLALWNNPRRKPRASDLFIEGLASMKIGECEQALVSFRLAIRKKPTYAWPWWGTGVCLLERDKTDEAITVLKMATILDPSIAPAHYALGYTYARQGKRDSAYKEYQALKGIDPDLARKLASELPQ
jgi:tetratricopeptide (TPR) repeat protein